VLQRRAHVGIAQHAGQLASAGRAARRLHVARGEAALRSLCHHQVVIGKDGDLGEVGDHEHLARAARAARHTHQGVAHPSPHLTADPLIHFVEHERRHRVVLRQDDLERQHQTRQLASRRDLGERPGLHPDIQLDFKHDRLRPIPPGRRETGEVRDEAPAGHPQRRQGLGYGRGEPRGALPPFRAERGTGARELGGGRRALLGDLAEVQVGGIEQVELARGAVARRQHVRERRPVLLGQPEQHVAALFDVLEPAGVGLDPGGVVAGRLCQLAHIREGAIEQLPPLAGGRIEPLESRDELCGAGEAGGIERLLELAGEPHQLFRVGEALRLRFEGLVLADLRLGSLDLLDHMAQVVGLALHLLAAGLELRVTALELAQPFVRVPHRHALDGGIGVGVQDVALRVRSEQGLRLVLAVQVYEQGAQLGEHAHGGRAAVHPGPRAPFPGDLAFEHQAAVVQLQS